MYPVYFSSTLAWQLPVTEAIELAKRSALQGMEIWAEHVWYYETAGNQICDRNNQQLGLTLHAPSWDLNIASLNHNVRQASVTSIYKSLVLAEEIGAVSLTIHPGHKTMPAADEANYEQAMLESLSAIDEAAYQHGVRISLELMESKPKEIYITPERLNKILNAFPNMASTFDLAHVNWSEEPIAIYGALQNCDKVHVSDNTLEQMHVPLGTGMIDKSYLEYFLHEPEQPVIVEGLDQSMKSWNQNLKYIKNCFSSQNRFHSG